MAAVPPFSVSVQQAGLTVAALLRTLLPGQSWSEVRRLIETRRARVGGEPCLDPARRLREGETVELLARPAPRPQQHEATILRHRDEHVVVVGKPSGMRPRRHPSLRARTACP